MIGFLKFFLELEIFVPVYLVFELAIPVLRGRPKFPATRWLGRGLLFFLPKRTSTESLLDASNRRLREAKIRMDAARTDLTAAELERGALSLEDGASGLRSGADPEASAACVFCGSRSRVVVATCCGRLVCPSHRGGTGTIGDGFTCYDHPFGF